MPPYDELKTLMLRAPRLTIAAAESLTTGAVQQRLSALAGASEFFAGGITAYSLDQKVRQLGVSRAEAERVNCVSAEVARQMARGAAQRFDTTLAVATTGYAEPAPVLGVTAPFAHWALVHRLPGDAWREQSGRVELPGATRAEAKDRTAEAVMEALLAYLRALRAAGA